MTLETGRIQACLNWCRTMDVDSERLKTHEIIICTRPGFRRAGNCVSWLMNCD